MSQLNLRKMTQQEFARYSRSSFESFIRHAARASGESLEQVRLRVGGAPSEPGPEDLWYVIEHAGMPAGFFWIRLLPGTNEAFGYDIHLEESFRGQGHGRQAMLEGRKLLAGLGVKKLKITVFDDNLPARKLYASLGFLATGFHPKRLQHEMEVEV